jgi:hypothetical protein
MVRLTAIHRFSTSSKSKGSNMRRLKCILFSVLPFVWVNNCIAVNSINGRCCEAAVGCPNAELQSRPIVVDGQRYWVSQITLIPYHFCVSNSPSADNCVNGLGPQSPCAGVQLYSDPQCTSPVGQGTGISDTTSPCDGTPDVCGSIGI